MLVLDRVSPDLDRYKREHLGKIYINKNKVNMYISYDRGLLESYKELLTEELYILSGGIYRILNKVNIIAFLKEFYGAKDEDFVNRNTSNSLASNIVQNLIRRGIASSFLTKYSEYTSIKASVEKMEEMMTRRIDTNLKTIEGDPISEIKYSLSTAITNRVYTVQENIQNISYRYLNCITAPSGYILIGVDFDQIEPRIQYYVLYRDINLDESFIRADDTYEFMFNVTNPDNTSLFTKEFRDKFKVEFLSAVYGQHVEVTKKEIEPKEVATNLHEWLENNDRRKEYISRVSEKLSKGEAITISTYFGNRIKVEPTDNSASSDIRKITNYPVQGTAHEIVAHFTLEVLDRARSKNLDLRLMVSRHDEPVFLAKIDQLDDIITTIRECSIIRIDDWKPMTASQMVSIYYKENEVRIKHNDITENIIHEVLLTPKTNYFPIKEELKLVIGYEFFRINDDTLLTIAYAQSKTTNEIFGIADKNTTIKELIPKLMREIVELYEGYDFNIEAPLPMPFLIQDILKDIESKNIDSSFIGNQIFYEDRDFQIIRTILYRLLQKNPSLEKIAKENSAMDYGFRIRVVQP